MQMVPILSLRARVRALLRRRALPRQPIIFDFTTGRAYRANDQEGRAKDLAEAMKDAATKTVKKRVVKAVEGIPPEVVTQPKT